MNNDLEQLTKNLARAVEQGNLLAASRDNILELLGSSDNAVAWASVTELLAAGAWTELNDRFFRKLAFGTGGLRGRTIGKHVTMAERGVAADGERPDHPCTGTNAMNFFNASRATQGLARYLIRCFPERKPAIVFSYDTRHFSKEFAEFCAKVASENGCDVYLFDGPRATPEMSFAIRLLNASAGVQITASHNPAHDNGYKVNFADGGQIIEPHATTIITEVNAISSETYPALPADQQGTVKLIGAEVDEPYLQRLETLLLRPELLENSTLKIVFTALHGTGGVLVPRLLKKLGFTTLTVPEQDGFDGRFPTVVSPNPENGPALQLGMTLAEKEGADLVIGTDPDCDRMGVGVRDAEGKMVLITGNQIATLMAWYRVKTFRELGVVTPLNQAHATLIKTFVTTPLLRAIAEKNGIGCLDTLTGFKYIAAKLNKYEKTLPPDLQVNYRSMPEETTRTARLQHTKFFIFGGEESYGYLGTDFVRDKDGNGAVVMFAEVAAYASARGQSLTELLDEIYAEYGYYLEVGQSLSFEGAAGAAQIAKLADSYVTNPLKTVDGCPVARARDFANETIIDEESEVLPKEKMLIVELADGRSFAVRPSGTEPKIKYYLFGNSVPKAGKVFDGEGLAAAQTAVRESLASLWGALKADVDARLLA